MGPCCDLLIDLQPQISCMLWLDARDVSKVRTTGNGARLELGRRAGRARRRRASRDRLTGDFARPAQASQKTNSYQRTAATGTMIRDLYRSQIPGTSALQIRAREAKTALHRWTDVQTGTLTACMRLHLHGVAFGWRPDRGRHQGSAMVGLKALHPGG